MARQSDPLNSSLQQLNWLFTKNAAHMTPEAVAREEKTKPSLSYSQLIREAIESSPGRRATLSGIYEAVAARYPFYANSPSTTWKNSIRHNLSLNKTFTKLSKAPGDTGKGSYWVIRKEKEKPESEADQQQERANDEGHSRIPQKSRPAPLPEPSPSAPFPSSSLLPLPAEEEIDDDLSLFESYDLSASFRSVYDQVFQRRPLQSTAEQEARIDWLKIGLEAAGMDCRDNEDMANVNANHLRDLLEGNPTRHSTPSPGGSMPSFESFITNRRRKHDDTLSQINFPQPKKRQTLHSGEPTCTTFDEDEDDFDWNTIV